jgi:hypothetical protein
MYLSVVLTAAAILIPGCNANSEAQHFAGSIMQLTKKWSVDAIAFGKRIHLEKDPTRLRADLDRLQAQIKELVANAKTLHVPPDKEAHALSMALQTYFADQESMVTRDFEELISISGSPTPDMNRFREILARCQQFENADLARLHQEEAAYLRVAGMQPAVR